MNAKSTSLVLLCLVAMHAAAQSQWSAGPARPIPRVNSKLAYDSARGRVVLVGGGADFGSGTYPQSDNWEYDGTSWERGVAQPASLETCGEHGVAFDSDRRVAVMTCWQVTTSTEETWEYDGQSWTQGPDVPPGSSYPLLLMAYDTARSRMMLLRSYVFGSNPTELFEYDGVSWSQSPVPLPPFSTNPGYRTVVYDRARLRLVVLDVDTWEFDGTRWYQGPAPPAVTFLGFGAYDAGRQRTVLISTSGLPPTHDTWEYDGSSWMQSGATLPEPITEGWAMAHDSLRGRIVLFGGADRSGVPRYFSNNTWEYDGTTWIKMADTLPRAVTGHAVAYDSTRQRVVMFGGAKTDGTLLADTWVYASRWYRGAVAPAGLSARRDAAMAFDAARNRVVLFGGDAGSGSRRNDTWECDGASWTQGPAAPPALAPRLSHAMAFDATRSRVILFGGDTLAGLVNDTWRYDGTAWVPDAVAPPALTARAGHAMTYDATRQAIVLFGGNDGTDRNDTWILDASGWAQGPSAPPSLAGRRLMAMGYDDAQGYVVLFGGSFDSGGNTNALNDTWVNDASGWRSGPAAAATLSPRQGIAAAYDGQHHRLVLWGGLDGSGYKAFEETWELTSPRAAYVVGEGPGQPNPNRVKVLDDLGLPRGADITAYGAGAWGINVASADIDTSTPAEIVTAPGPGPSLGPQIRAFRATGSSIARVNFFAYGTLKYGAEVGGARLDADAPSEMVTGPGPGVVFGPQVRGWNYDGSSITPMSNVSFFAYGTLKYGVHGHGGDVDGDDFDEILTTPGPGPTFAPQVRGWNVDGAIASPMSGLNFVAYATAQYGARAAAGDVDDDGNAEIGTAPGPGAALTARFLGFDYDGSVSPLARFDATPFGTHYGGRLGFGDVGGVPGDDLMAAPGADPAAPSRVMPFAWDATLGLQSVYGRTVVFATAYGADATGGQLGL